MTWIGRLNKNLGIYFSLASILVLLVGCSGKNMWSSEEEGIDEAAAESIPYHANDFRDILVPNELDWDREGSMALKTESFAGGVLKFVGRVEVNSLADFFSSTMVKNGWKLVASAKYKNVLLAFAKPHKTATVTIFESEISGKTTVRVYVSDDISSRKGINPFAEETIR